MSIACYVTLRRGFRRPGLLAATREQEQRAALCGAHHTYVQDVPEPSQLVRYYTAAFNEHSDTDGYIRRSLSSGGWLLADIQD